MHRFNTSWLCGLETNDKRSRTTDERHATGQKRDAIHIEPKLTAEAAVIGSSAAKLNAGETARKGAYDAVKSGSLDQRVNNAVGHLQAGMPSSSSRSWRPLGSPYDG